MFKTYHFVVILLCLSLSNNAIADCTTSPKVTDLIPSQNAVDVLNNHTACYTGSQEEHHPDGKLWDYKTGSLTDPVDPRRQIGEWSASGSSVTYQYLIGRVGEILTPGDGPYGFTLRYNGGNSYSLCGVITIPGSTPGNDQDITLVSGFEGCPPP